jgi:hypothetical protein
MNKSVKCVKITPDGNMSEITNHKEDKDWKEMRGRDFHSLPLADKWGFRLSSIMQDFFEEGDPINEPASMIYHALKHAGWEAEVLKGTVFIFNEDSDKLIDFTVKELNQIIYKACMERVVGNI